MALTHAQIKSMEQEAKDRKEADLQAARENPKVDAPSFGASLLVADSGNNSDGQFSWSDTRPALLLKCIRVVNAAGNSFGTAVNRAKTGGTVTILAGRDTPKLYAEGIDQANAVLVKILLAYGQTED